MAQKERMGGRGGDDRRGAVQEAATGGDEEDGGGGGGGRIRNGQGLLLPSREQIRKGLLLLLLRRAGGRTAALDGTTVGRPDPRPADPARTEEDHGQNRGAGRGEKKIGTAALLLLRLDLRVWGYWRSRPREGRSILPGTVQRR